MKNASKIGMKYRKLSTGAKLAVVASRKRHGDVSRVATATGFSPNWTSEVLAGLGTNNRILNKAYDMTRGRIRNSSLIG
jgi:hypothetical protein